ncbi:DUF4955 domain-containing protein [Vibrio nomapromontoriensis]|uniref:DUF4955 domain-containing protein n=1 Tax=Vibrio nomapromontoriensis TaxID=2910246 RepID=UPI003D106759
MMDSKKQIKSIPNLLSVSLLCLSTTAIADDVLVSDYWQHYLATRQHNSDLYSGENKTDQPVLNNFSYAGYHFGEKPIPTSMLVNHEASSFTAEDIKYDQTTGYRIFLVDDYGANANDGKSDKQAIKRAVSEAERYVGKDAERGAIVQFSAGRYRINEASDMTSIDPASKLDVLDGQTIKIRSSNIVLRGMGQTATELYMSQPLLPVDSSKMWTTPRIIKFEGNSKGTHSSRVIASLVGGASKSITLSSTKGFEAGDWVRLSGKISRKEIIEKQVYPYQLEASWTAINRSLNIVEYHQITEVEGDGLVFKAPVQIDIDPQDTWLVEAYEPIENVGIEHLTLRGNWQEKFKHHARSKDGTIHDSAWSLLELNNVVNGWVKQVTLADFNAGVQLSATGYSTVRDVLLTGTPGHLSLQFNASFNNLSMDVNDESNAWHAPGFSHRASSNVHLRTRYLASTSSDLHGAQPRINLFDNLKGGWIPSRWGAAISNLPNHLAGLTYWNFEHIGAPQTGFEMMSTKSKYGRLIAPYMIGNHGSPITFASMQEYSKHATKKGEASYKKWLPDQPQAWLESDGSRVFPESLYQAQLEQRLGVLPEWVR